MKKFLLAVMLMLLTSLSVFARAKVQGFASQGGQVVITAGVSSSTKVVKTFPGCTVTVFFTGTTNPATLFSDNASTPKSNPFTSSLTDALYFFYIDDGRYDIRFSGTGISTPFTLSDINVVEAGGGGGGGAVISFNGRTGVVVPLTNDYTWAQVNKTTSSLADIATRSATDLTSGTLPDARFPAVLPAASGVNLTNLNASNLASGTIPNGRFPATLPALDGSLLTNLNATAITTGTLADARLSSNVPLKNAVNTFSNNNIFTALVGIGAVTPRRPLDVLSVSQAQLRLTYTDNSVFTDLQTNSTGSFIITPTAGVIFDTVGNQIDPLVNYDQNLGQINKKYLSLHAAELVVETLVSQNTVATIGGRVLIAPSTPLIADLAPATTTVDVKYNNLNNGDRIYMEAQGNVEFMAVTSGSTPITGGFRYSVTRNLDGTGANQWFAGDAIVNTGTTGNGFIDLYSVRGVKSGSQTGPTIVGNVRNSGTFNDWTENWAIGNLNGLYGYGITTYGVALGPYLAGTAHVTIDSTNGFRIYDGLSTVRAQIAADGSGFLANNNIVWDASGNATIAGWAINTASITKNEVKIAAGENVTGTAGVAEAWFGKAAAGYTGLFVKGTTNAAIQLMANNSSIGSAGRPFLTIHDGTRYRIALGELNTTVWDGAATNSMGMKIWDTSGNILAHFSDVANTISGWTITNTKISSTGIDILSGGSAALAFGTTPPTSASAGTGIWLDRTGLYGLSSNVVQAKITSTGKLQAGAGEVNLDANGFYVDSSLVNQTSWMRWFDTASGGSLTNTSASITINRSGTPKNTGFTVTSRAINGVDTTGADFLTLASQNDSTGFTQISLTKYATAHASKANKGFINFFVSNGVVIEDTGGTSEAATSALLELKSTTGAFIPPKMTGTQRDALTASDGMVLYNTTTNKLQVRAAGAWVDLH